MSNLLLLAAVTSLLKYLLENGLVRYGIPGYVGDVRISALPPNRIETGDEEQAQINLFLFQIAPRGLYGGKGYEDAADGAASNRPLMIDLHYLATAYGGQDLHIELLLGYVLELFHDIGALDQAAVQRILNSVAGAEGGMGHQPILAALSKGDLKDRIAEVRITPQVTGIQEMHALWSSVQTPYRPSHLYRVSVTVSSPGAGEAVNP